ncbi:TrbI/VirB10 family protein [Xanthomonas sp. Kuri4-1]
MSQNTPNPPEPRDGFAGDHATESNPYYQAGTRQAEPDLDAGAPNLRNEENQRLNRKALLFLGGIVLLLVVMGIFLFSRGSEDAKSVAKPREVAPYVPPVPTELDNQAPVPVAQQPAEPVPLALPPMPPQGDSNFMPQQNSPSQPSGPSLMQRRMADGSGTGTGARGAGGAQPAMDPTLAALGLGAQGQAGIGGMPGMGPGGPGGPQQPAQPASIRSQLENVSQASFLRKPDTLLLRGTFIRCVLETRIVTDYSGFTSCVVTEPVYSVNGKSLLLPKGSKLSGTYGGGAKVERVGVIWDRITTPTGIDVMMSSPGVDNLGGAGHPGQLDNHWASRISSALMVSLLADAFKYAAAENGPESTAISDGGTIYSQPYESATARTMERMAGEVVQQAMSRAPTVTINQGTVVNVYVAKDVDFSGVVGLQR